KQRMHVLLAGCGDVDNFAVDGLLASQVNLAQQPPDAGVEPEESADDFFDQGKLPVPAANVRHFVTGDRLLRLDCHVGESQRQQDDWMAKSESHWAGDVGREADGGTDTESPLQVFEEGRKRP